MSERNCFLLIPLTILKNYAKLRTLHGSLHTNFLCVILQCVSRRGIGVVDVVDFDGVDGVDGVLSVLNTIGVLRTLGRS